MNQVNLIKTSQISEVLLKIDRSNFTDDLNPYENKPKTISCGEVMTSPSTHALTLEILLPSILNAKKILDIGCGTGYLSQCFALTNPNASVMAIDIHKDLIEKAKSLSNLPNLIFNRCEAHEITDENFNVINVGFAAPKALHEFLTDKLETNGILLCPVTTGNSNN